MHFELTFAMDPDQLRVFHTTMSNALRNWPGGDAREQMVLTFLKEKSFALLLETQFMEK